MNEMESAVETLSDETDTKTCGGRQGSQMEIRRRQMRPSSRHIASIAAC